MSPSVFLILVIAITGVATLVDVVARRRRTAVLRQLAAEWRMNYSPADPLHIAPKVAGRFPIIGAANVRVRDLIYGVANERHRYVFTAEFTTGVVRTKRRVVRVATFSEPRDRDQPDPSAPVTLAEEKGDVVEQYRSLAPAGVGRADAEAVPATV